MEARWREGVRDGSCNDWPAGETGPCVTLQKGALVMVVEDENEVAEIVMAYLRREGLRVVHATNGRAALDMHLAMKPDLVLLDVLLPYLDGWGVLGEIRRRDDTPVIMLTAHDMDVDKLMALRIGADDYVVKPFNPAEVVARSRAVLRRSGANEFKRPGLLRVGALVIDPDAFEARIERDGTDVALSLTLTEFRLLAHMARAPHRAHTRAELLERCLPEGDALERTVDSHLSKLRKKLEIAGGAGLLRNIRGIGYRFESLS